MSNDNAEKELLISNARKYFMIDKPISITNCTCEDCMEVVNSFNTNKNQELSKEFIDQVGNDSSSFMVLSVDSFKYIFPKFLSLILESNFNDELYGFVLAYLELPSVNASPEAYKDKLSDFKTFTPEQSTVIREFLRFAYDNDKIAYNQKDIQRSLDRWWDDGYES